MTKPLNSTHKGLSCEVAQPEAVMAYIGPTPAHPKAHRHRPAAGHNTAPSKPMPSNKENYKGHPEKLIPPSTIRKCHPRSHHSS